MALVRHVQTPSPTRADSQSVQLNQNLPLKRIIRKSWPKQPSAMQQRLKELDELLMLPENASDMTLVTEYTTTKRCLDEEVERWEQLSETLESFIN